MWNFIIVGSQYQINRSFQIRAEAGFCFEGPIHWRDCNTDLIYRSSAGVLSVIL